MSSANSTGAGLAGRYAKALFDLAADAGAVGAIEQDLDGLGALLADSADFRAFVDSPLVDTAHRCRAVAAIAEKAGLHPFSARLLGVLAENGRLAALAGVIEAFRQLARDGRGEEEAEIVSASPLAADQLAALENILKTRSGRAVQVQSSVDPSLLGGLVVRIGSRMIDHSLKTKIDRLRHAMKEGA